MSSEEFKLPKWPFKLIRFLLKPEYMEEIEGDMEELYSDLLEQHAAAKAKRLLWKETIQLMRPSLIRNMGGNYRLNYYGMFKNYLIVAWRNLFKQPGFSSINILSLTLGMAACMLIYLFVQNENSFDSIHQKKDRIYRLCELQTWPGIKPQKVPITWPKMGFALPEYFPEVENYTRFQGIRELLWETEHKKLIVEKAGAVDSSFFEVFDFPVLKGESRDILVEPNTVLLSEELARRYFGTDEVLGKTLKQGEDIYQIKGVFANVPEQSHLQFDLLLSLSTFRKDNPDFNQSTGSNFMITYVLLNPEADVEAMEAKFPDYLDYLSEDDNVNEMYSLFMQSLEDVHLASTDIEHDYHNYNKFNGRYIDVFILTGIFIMIIACVNFMNLTIARANTRFKEVGIRKTIGATRLQLVIQFVLESLLLALGAFMIALMLVSLVLPSLNQVIERNLQIQTFWNLQQVFMLLAGVLLLGVLTGLYPALKMSAYRIASIIRGGGSERKKSFLRSSLIVVQFSLSMGMIICTLVVVQQLFFINSKDVGFDREHIMLIKMNDEVNDKYAVLKEELKQLSSVQGVTASGQRLGNNIHQWGTKFRKDTAIVNLAPSNLQVDYDFLEVYGIEMIEGRNFSREYANDNGLAFIINQSLAREMGEDSPVGKSMGLSWYPDDSLGTVIGVTENFNFNTLHHKVNALALVVYEDWNFREMTVKLTSGDVNEAVQDIDRVWKEHVVDFPLSFQFLDQHFEEVYKSERQMGFVVTWVAVLSVLISCLGLFGLASLSIERRIKEIGVRKVMGATTSQLLMLLSKNFAGLILLAFVIAVPLSYTYLDGWLSDFAFRINISPLVFVLGGGMALAIAMGTISFHTIRAARTNPAQVLRDE